MKIGIIILILFLSNKIFSQIQYYNHNECDKYTIRLWNNHKIDSLKIPEIKRGFSVNTKFNLDDNLSDETILKNIKSNIFINELQFYFKECFENNCACNFNLEHAFKIWSNKPSRIIFIGYFKPKPDLYSLIVQIQYPDNDSNIYYIDKEGNERDSMVLTYNNNDRHLYVYLLNFDNSYKLISTGLIGEFMKNNDGFSYLEIVPTFSIRKNAIIIKEKSIHYPTDMIVHYSKSNCMEKKIYKIRINDNGQIEKQIDPL